MPIRSLLTLAALVLPAASATLRHHFPLDHDGLDAVGKAELVTRGEDVAFQPENGAIGGFAHLGGQGGHLIDEAGTLSVLGDYRDFRPFSIACWVRQKPLEALGGTQAVAGLSTDSTDPATFNAGFELVTRESSGGTGVRVRARSGGAGDDSGEIASGVNVSDGRWHHLVAVYDENSRSLFIDGVRRGGNERPVPLESDPIRNFTLGAFIRAGKVLDPFHGDLDDLRLYDGKLSESEAAALFDEAGLAEQADGGVTDLPAVERIDPMIGAADRGSCPPGPVLPHASIYPSPDTLDAAASGYRHGSPWVGFSQLHALGAGSSTLSFGNFLVSPQIGPGHHEADHQSPVSGMEAKPWALRAKLDRWNTPCTVVPARRAAIYEFQFPAGDDARIYFDVARKLGRSDAMKSGSLRIDAKAGTISGGGTFDGNWNPAPYELYFFAKSDRIPTAAGTWQGDDVRDGETEATIHDRQPLGGWMRFDTREGGPVRLKIAVSFTSVEKAREFLEADIPQWDIEGLEAAARTSWEKAMLAIDTPGISAEEGRKLYTALYHSLIQPRDRTGDAAGWPADAALWDDHYTCWDTWLTLFPLLAITQPDTLAAIVNSFGERYEHNGRAETAFIQGKDYQVGQGGDEVDLIIADAFAKKVPGIDWKKVWKLLDAHASRRMPDYLKLGYVASDGDHGDYDWRTRSGSSTLAFSYEDWAAAQVARGLGHRGIGDRLEKRSRNWREVWDETATGDGFTGFVRARKKNGDFSTSSVTSGDDFYQGTCWNYSWNVPHERDAMIGMMGGRARFLQRLDFAFRQESNAYVDYTNEVCFHSTWLFAHAGRPYLSSHWAERLRQHYGPYSFPGDEDSGAMSSLYFFLTAGLFPVAGQDLYYLHGPRIPRLDFHLGNGRTFTITASDAGDSNPFIQSVTLNGKPLDRPVIRHADIAQGGTLAFAMGPVPTTWGTRGDFTPKLQGSRKIETWQNGEASIPSTTLSKPGDKLVFYARFEPETEGGPLDLTWGLAGREVTYQATTKGEPSFSKTGETLARYSLQSAEPGPCRLVLTLRRNEHDGLDFFAAAYRESDQCLVSAFTGSDPDPAGFEFDHAIFAGQGRLEALISE
ncbi:GH92 family glycosyl hydrolase [Haloferula sargassicola]|uniref:LamG-like jellyroll fold domain-containing protein n=1 Tax=Haloferula sargassicola TaxID=490096 RepID=A0ABP9UHJ5_9BACT